ncbi:MAG: hypothetical protein PHR28_12780 [candidate division Zixibacteria bacterium]|nr:hypothetical protein [candidate division Zixibacteria bacterium]
MRENNINRYDIAFIICMGVLFIAPLVIFSDDLFAPISIAGILIFVAVGMIISETFAILWQRQERRRQNLGQE